jgi:DNA-binding MarR family transcriptional regulator
MEALKDVWASFIEGIRDRTTNPLTFAFALSWSLWNYRFFVVLLGDGKVKEKLEAIDGIYAPGAAKLMGGALLYPVLSAAVYVFLYPLVGTAAIWAYRSYQVWASNIVKNVEKGRVLSTAEAAALTRRYERERKKLDVELEERGNEISALRRALDLAEENSSARAKVDPATHPNISQPPQVADAGSSSDPSEAVSSDEADAGFSASLPYPAIAVLTKLSEQSSPRGIDDIAAYLGINFTVVENSLHHIEELGLVTQSKDSFGVQRWSLTREGKSLVLPLLATHRGSTTAPAPPRTPQDQTK